jgi:branched-subunit amino acid transport protein
MSSRLLLLVAAVGFCTYLMRLIPLALTVRRNAAGGEQRLPPLLNRFFAAVGPSFVAVFLVYSILPVSGRVEPVEVMLKLAALIPVALVYLKTRHLGRAVLAGLSAYGALYLLLR